MQNRGLISEREQVRFAVSARGFTLVELLMVIVVIAILAAISVVSYNGITQRASLAVKQADLTQRKKLAELYKVDNDIACPTNYAFVYGNSTLGTSDFCVMKYEAKDVGGVATSESSGTPWVSISQVNASAAAAAAGGHLLTDAEWMTIAADILSVKYNWSGGAIGSGYVYQGHVSNNPGEPLAASDDDADDRYGITGGLGSAVGSNNGRVLWLSSGDAIWDFTGNVWEWTADTINGSGSQPSPTGWNEFNVISSWGTVPVASRTSTLASVSGLSDAGSWGTAQGIGALYSNTGLSDTRSFIRGGGWYDGTSAGVLTLVLDFMPDNTGINIGFRVAL